VLSKTGLQLPVMPLILVVGNTASADPSHIGATDVNVGIILPLLTPIVIVAIEAHSVTAGVKVYVVVVVLSNAGVHVPVIPLVLVVGNALNVPPVQIAATGVNVGMVSVPVISY
jgi:hypothetical protein